MGILSRERYSEVDILVMDEGPNLVATAPKGSVCYEMNEDGIIWTKTSDSSSNEGWIRMAFGSAVQSIGVYLGIDAKATGPSGIADTIDFAGRSFFVTGVLVKCDSATAITVPASVSVGTNAATYDNILPITALTGLTASGHSLFLPVTSPSVVLAPLTNIVLNVTTGATGTAQNITPHVLGVYL